jgi:hypothetical protein
MPIIHDLFTSRKKLPWFIWGFPPAVMVLWKALFLFWGKFPFNSDEAIVALMARHILAGSRPVFFYGQSYMGSVDAYLVAAGFALLGQQVWVIRLVQVVLYGMVVGTTIYIAYRISRRSYSALIAGLFMALPTVNVMLYTTVSLGGYNEALLVGNILIILVIRIKEELGVPEKRRNSLIALFFWGLFSGLGIWANGLSIVYIIPTALYILWGFMASPSVKIDRISLKFVMPRLLIIITGVLLGSFPYWLYGIQNGWGSLFHELFGSAVSVESGSLLTQSLAHLINFLALGLPVLFGIRPPWEVRWLVFPLIPFVVAFWGWVLYRVVQLVRNKSIDSSIPILLGGISFLLIMAFIFTPFGVDPSGRYFIPVNVILVVMVGIAVGYRGRFNPVWGVVVILVFHVLTTFQCAFKDPPALTTQFYSPTIIRHEYDQALIRFLEDEGESFGYSNYWVSYPIAFLSEEELIFVPRLPYHVDMRYTERDDRYLPYDNMVQNADRVAYITTNNPLLDDFLEASFQEKDIDYQEQFIGDYHVFYALSEIVRPEDLGLGTTSE